MTAKGRNLATGDARLADEETPITSSIFLAPDFTMKSLSTLLYAVPM